MSKVTLNSPIKTLSGKLNRQSDLVFVTRHRTERVSTRTLSSSSTSSPASCIDTRSSSPSPAQQQARENFVQLRRQAQHILATPSLRDRYLRQWTKQRQFHTLLGYIMHSLSTSPLSS